MMLKELNKRLPKNVCIQLYEFFMFPILLPKLKDLWTGIVAPTKDENEPLEWTMAYLNYQVEGEDYYLLWFFFDEGKVSRIDIENEVKKFLEDEKDGTQNIIEDYR